MTRTHSGSLRRRGAPGGERNGESVSTRRRSGGRQAGDLRGRLLPGRNDEAGEADRRAELEHRLGVVDRAAERVDQDRAAASRRTPGARASSASWASRSPAAERQWRIAGLPVSAASARFRRRFASWARIGEKTPVVVEAGLADRDDPRVAARAPRSRPTPRRRPASASCGWTPTAASSHGNRSTSSSAAADDQAFQPGTRIRSTPAVARRADDRVDVVVEAVGLEMAVAVDEAHRPDCRRCAARAGASAGGRQSVRPL